MKEAMLSFLFRRLTADPKRGAALFGAVTAEARKPHWYVEGKVPDTLDGRFAVLATAAALTTIRLEQLAPEGDAVSVALTERFIEVMESEHRELGLGDPTLGKRVRKLVGSLSRRTDAWRLATGGASDWFAATRDSLYKDKVDAAALDHSAESLRDFWAHLERLPLERLATGELR
jgi:cytochrome b pre-mRNA-processing protein 3